MIESLLLLIDLALMIYLLWRLVRRRPPREERDLGLMSFVEIRGTGPNDSRK